MSGHTPGPWRTASYDQGLTWKVETAEGRKAVASYIAGLGKTDEANANLIAAAPDLLEALKGLLPQTFNGNPSRAEEIAHWERERALGRGEAAFVLAAYAAIAKAEGR